LEKKSEAKFVVMKGLQTYNIEEKSKN